MTTRSYSRSEILEDWRCSGGAPDEESLKRIHRAWLDNVPFENITKLIHARSRPADSPARTLTDFWNDYRKWNSGGTCFDSAAAFRELLDLKGFCPQYVFCRLPGRAERSHVALLVSIEDSTWLVDIGYALPEPIPLPKTRSIRRRTPLYDVEIRRGPEEEFLLFTEDGRGARFRYSFTGGVARPAEFEEAWLHTFRPAAPYMNRLALGRFRGAVRYIYKDTATLYVLSRQEQKLARIPDPAVPWLSGIFGIHPELLERGMTLLPATMPRYAPGGHRSSRLAGAGPRNPHRSRPGAVSGPGTYRGRGNRRQLC